MRRIMWASGVDYGRIKEEYYEEVAAVGGERFLAANIPNKEDVVFTQDSEEVLPGEEQQNAGDDNDDQ
jgi:hypothetical protein